MFHFFSGLSYPAISRACMTWSFPLWLEEKQSHFWKSSRLGSGKLGRGSSSYCLTKGEQWEESLPGGLCTWAHCFAPLLEGSTQDSETFVGSDTKNWEMLYYPFIAGVLKNIGSDIRVLTWRHEWNVSWAWWQWISRGAQCKPVKSSTTSQKIGSLTCLSYGSCVLKQWQNALFPPLLLLF